LAGSSAPCRTGPSPACADAGAEAAEALDAIELVQAYGREGGRLANRSPTAVEATFAAAMRRITCPQRS
jgi:hypothetical protein